MVRMMARVAVGSRLDGRATPPWERWRLAGLQDKWAEGPALLGRSQGAKSASFEDKSSPLQRQGSTAGYTSREGCAVITRPCGNLTMTPPTPSSSDENSQE